MNGKDVVDFRELSREAVWVIERAMKEYNNLVKFLTEQDEKSKQENGYIYDVAVEKYQLLHEILGIEGEPKWVS